MKYKDIKENEEVQALISKGNENLGILGYTDHSEVHAALVAERAASILEILGYKKKQIELVKVAAYMHDIGNAINRSRHAEYGSLLANDILKETGTDRQDRLTVVSAIAHHDESTGGATDVISAALIIADKTDVRRNRVRQKPKASFDVHWYIFTNQNYFIYRIEAKKVVVVQMFNEREDFMMKLFGISGRTQESIDYWGE